MKRPRWDNLNVKMFFLFFLKRIMLQQCNTDKRICLSGIHGFFDDAITARNWLIGSCSFFHLRKDKMIEEAEMQAF